MLPLTQPRLTGWFSSLCTHTPICATLNSVCTTYFAALLRLGGHRHAPLLRATLRSGRCEQHAGNTFAYTYYLPRCTARPLPLLPPAHISSADLLPPSRRRFRSTITFPRAQCFSHFLSLNCIPAANMGVRSHAHVHLYLGGRRRILPLPLWHNISLLINSWCAQAFDAEHRRSVVDLPVPQQRRGMCYTRRPALDAVTSLVTRALCQTFNIFAAGNVPDTSTAAHARAAAFLASYLSRSLNLCARWRQAAPPYTVRFGVFLTSAAHTVTLDFLTLNLVKHRHCLFSS